MWRAIPDDGNMNGESAVSMTCCPWNDELERVGRSQVKVANSRDGQITPPFVIELQITNYSDVE